MAKFKDFIADGINYCKISKSRPDISGKCIEPFYKEYVTGKIATGSSLSFIPEENAIDAICYGDTYTEFNFSDDVTNMALGEDEIICRGGGLMEYSAKRLLVGEQYSLNEPWVNARIISNASTMSLAVALEHIAKDTSPILRHYENLGLNSGLMYWQHVGELYKKEIDDGKSVLSATKKIKETASKDLHALSKPLPAFVKKKKNIFKNIFIDKEKR